MFSFIILVVIIAWTLSAGLKRYERTRKFSGWRVWLASALAVSICYLAAHVDSIGVPLSWLSPMIENRLGCLILCLCFLAVYFGVQLIVNRALLRDGAGVQLDVSVNTRLCVRSILSLLSIPLAMVVFHGVALCLIFVA
jgi:hypothetical protein